jgi:hypothetical protein
MPDVVNERLMKSEDDVATLESIFTSFVDYK